MRVRTLALLFLTGTLATAESAVTAVVNGASFSELLAPGGWITIFGTDLADSTARATALPLPATLGGVTVMIQNTPAALGYVSPTQINAIVPWVPVAGFRRVGLVVHGPRGPLREFIIALNRAAPGLFTRNSAGTGPALVFDTSFRPIDAVSPGDVVVLYATGLGETSPGVSIYDSPLNEPIRQLVDYLDVFIGEEKAELLFAGAAPGFPGVYQVNVRVPVPWTDRIILKSFRGLSNIGEVGITQANNAAGTAATVESLFPTPDAVVTWTLPLHAAKFTVQFDVRPGAKPFRMAAVGETGGSFISIDPVRGTFESSTTVPTLAARTGDFSAATRWDIRDLTDYCSSFAGYIVPVSRLGPAYIAAARSLPVPQSEVQGTATGMVTSAGAWSGSTWSGSFGDNMPIACGLAPTRTTSFAVYVDGKRIARRDYTYRLR